MKYKVKLLCKIGLFKGKEGYDKDLIHSFKESLEYNNSGHHANDISIRILN